MLWWLRSRASLARLAAATERTPLRRGGPASCRSGRPAAGRMSKSGLRAMPGHCFRPGRRRRGRIPPLPFGVGAHIHQHGVAGLPPGVSQFRPERRRRSRRPAGRRQGFPAAGIVAPGPRSGWPGPPRRCGGGGRLRAFAVAWRTPPGLARHPGVAGLSAAMVVKLRPGSRGRAGLVVLSGRAKGFPVGSGTLASGLPDWKSVRPQPLMSRVSPVNTWLRQR